MHLQNLLHLTQTETDPKQKLYADVLEEKQTHAGLRFPKQTCKQRLQAAKLGHRQSTSDPNRSFSFH